MSSPAMLGKGGRSGLTRRVDKHNGRAVARAVLVEILCFEQQNQPSAGAARPIHKSRVSCDSLSRILLGDITISPWIGPQRVIGLCKWSRLNSCFDLGWPLWRVKKIEKNGLSQLLGRGNIPDRQTNGQTDGQRMETLIRGGLCNLRFLQVNVCPLGVSSAGPSGLMIGQGVPILWVWPQLRQIVPNRFRTCSEQTQNGLRDF